MPGAEIQKAYDFYKSPIINAEHLLNNIPKQKLNFL